jgi:hypothetical protein
VPIETVRVPILMVTMHPAEDSAATVRLKPGVRAQR